MSDQAIIYWHQKGSKPQGRQHFLKATEGLVKVTSSIVPLRQSSLFLTLCSTSFCKSKKKATKSKSGNRVGCISTSRIAVVVDRVSDFRAYDAYMTRVEVSFSLLYRHELLKHELP